MKLPEYKKFLHPFIGSLTLFQYTFQQYLGINSKAIRLTLYSYCNSEQELDSIMLSNSLFIFGCYIGTHIFKKCQGRSSRFIFLLSDLIYLLSNCFFIFVWLQNNQYYNICSSLEDCQCKQYYYITIFIISRTILGISIGINYTNCIIYIKEMSSQIENQFFLLFIPLQLIIGEIIGYYIFSDKYNNDTNLQPGFIFIIDSITIIRMILLIIIKTETPFYYFAVKKDIRKSKEVFQQIHTDNIQTFWDEIEKYEHQQSLGKQIIQNTYIKKYYKCVLLLFITQYSGQNLIALFDTQILHNPQRTIYIAYFFGLIIIIFEMIFYNKIKKGLQIYLGQILILIGLGLVGFNTQIWGIILIQCGYNLGLGSLLFQIIPTQIPNVGIINCITTQWMSDLAQLCIIGLINNKMLLQDQILTYELGFKVFFYLSLFGFIILMFLIKNPFKKRKQSQNAQLQQV